MIFEHPNTSADRFPSVTASGYGSEARPLEGRLSKLHIAPVRTVQLGLVARVATVFLPSAALGTVGHELGHWVAAHWLGCAPVLHFSSVSPRCSDALPMVSQMLGVASGPLGTMASGSVGMAMLWRWRQRHHRLDLQGVMWSMLALFWSRPVFNLVVQVGLLALGHATWQDTANNDEARLSLWMGLPQLALGIGCAIVAVGMCTWTARQIPRVDRPTWLVGAVMGALLGFAIWMGPVGPLLLP
ncbi:MAG TPA: hypothetical protein DFR83_16470 [Deltaproteobacteria bacterium]|nr:hypothetical protein [Deltaproteobacteria bacterium]